MIKTSFDEEKETDCGSHAKNCGAECLLFLSGQCRADVHIAGEAKKTLSAEKFNSLSELYGWDFREDAFDLQGEKQ